MFLFSDLYFIKLFKIVFRIRILLIELTRDLKPPYIIHLNYYIAYGK